MTDISNPPDMLQALINRIVAAGGEYDLVPGHSRTMMAGHRTTKGWCVHLRRPNRETKYAQGATVEEAVAAMLLTLDQE